jgi:hypothetical protein
VAVRVVGAGRKGSGGRRVDGAGEDVGAGRESFMTVWFDVYGVETSFTHIRI